MISEEIDKIFREELDKIKGVTSEFNIMLKRKNLLEAKMFRRRYDKMQKHLTGIPGLEATCNPFKRPHKPSVFSESISDATGSIPQNRELFENVIKEAFSDLLADIDEKFGL
jgi:hypothetical protein